MTEESQNLTNQSQIPPSVPIVPNNPKADALKNLITKISFLAKSVWQQIYSNKKVFWLICGMLGLLFLTLIVGLIFGKKTTTVINPNKTATPAPQVQTTPQLGINDQFSPIDQNLTNLKNQINTLDVKQSQLQPPAVNFVVKF